MHGLGFISRWNILSQILRVNLCYNVYSSQYLADKSSSYVETVLGCQGLLNGLDCTVSAVKTHEPVLSGQTTTETYVRSWKQFVKNEKCLPNSMFSVGISLTSKTQKDETLERKVGRE